MSTKETLLTKKNTAALHGAAILMMVYHHLFIGGNTWYRNEPTSLFDFLNFINFGKADSFQLTFAWFCKICVAIFAFTSGYAMYVQFKRRCADDMDLKTMYAYCFQRLWSFYKKYLLCFLFFITYTYIVGNPYGFDYSPLNYILNLIGIRATFNSTWWYILIYYIMVLISPLVYVLLERFKTKHYLALILLFVLSVVVSLVSGHLIDYLKFISKTVQNYTIIYLLIFMEGMFCGRYPFLDYLASKMNVITSLFLLLLTFIVRTLLIRAPSDCLFDLVVIVPFILSFTKLISYSDIIVKMLSYLGKYSSYIWYVHAYFYSYLFFNLVFRTDLSLFVYLQVMLYSLATSILFDLAEKKLNALFHKSK